MGYFQVQQGTEPGLLFAFIDESERDNSAYFLGSLLCNATQYEFITNSLNHLMMQSSKDWTRVSQFEEFHGSSIMRASDLPWRTIPLRARLHLYSQALLIIQESGARGYVEGINISKLVNRNYPHTFPPREIAFNYLLEQLDSCGITLNQLIQLWADKHHTSDVSASNFSKYQIVGTFGYKSSKLTQLINPISFIDSQTDRVLQASDLLTYLYNRVHTIRENDPRAVSEKLKLWKIIEPVMTPPRGRNRIWP